MATGGEPGTVAAKSLIEAASSWQTWVMFLCYMFSFGVELIVNGNIVTYFVKTFRMPPSKASTIGSVFSLLNICMRSLGGFWSDMYNVKFGITGRLWALFQQTSIMGICLIIFSGLTKDNSTDGGLLLSLIFWGAFTNMTEGGTFAVVPYVIPTAGGLSLSFSFCLSLSHKHTHLRTHTLTPSLSRTLKHFLSSGGVAGIIGAGGNMGALLGNALVIVLKGNAGPKPTRNLMFCALGWGAVASAMLVPCLWLPGISSMFCKAQTAAPEVEPEQPQKIASQALSEMKGPQPTFVHPSQPTMMHGY